MGSRRLWPRPRRDGSNRCFLINRASSVGTVRSASRSYAPCHLCYHMEDTGCADRRRRKRLTRKVVSAPHSQPSERSRVMNYRFISAFAGLAILCGARGSAADTECPYTWTVCSSSSDCASAEGMYRYCTYGLDADCNFYTVDCWDSSTPCSEADQGIAPVVLTRKTDCDNQWCEGRWHEDRLYCQW